MKYLSLAGVLMMNLALVPAVMLTSATPVLGQPVLVVAPPWSGGAAAVIARADGLPIGPEGAPFASLSANTDPAYVTQLQTAGAWLVLDGSVIAEICNI